LCNNWSEERQLEGHIPILLRTLRVFSGKKDRWKEREDRSSKKSKKEIMEYNWTHLPKWLVRVWVAFKTIEPTPITSSSNQEYVSPAFHFMPVSYYIFFPAQAFISIHIYSPSCPCPFFFNFFIQFSFINYTQKRNKTNRICLYDGIFYWGRQTWHEKACLEKDPPPKKIDC